VPKNLNKTISNKYLTKTEIKQLFDYLENRKSVKLQIINTMLEVLFASVCEKMDPKLTYTY